MLEVHSGNAFPEVRVLCWSCLNNPSVDGASRGEPYPSSSLGQRPSIACPPQPPAQGQTIWIARGLAHLSSAVQVISSAGAVREKRPGRQHTGGIASWNEREWAGRLGSPRQATEARYGSEAKQIIGEPSHAFALVRRHVIAARVVDMCRPPCAFPVRQASSTHVAYPSPQACSATPLSDRALVVCLLQGMLVRVSMLVRGTYLDGF
jgi:hypothetical protein